MPVPNHFKCAGWNTSDVIFLSLAQKFIIWNESNQQVHASICYHLFGWSVRGVPRFSHRLVPSEVAQLQKFVFTPSSSIICLNQIPAFDHGEGYMRSSQGDLAGGRVWDINRGLSCFPSPLN